jgi:hypothetical protein
MGRMMSDASQDYFADGARPGLSLANTYIRGTTLSADVAASGSLALDTNGERALNMVINYMDMDETGESIKNNAFALYSPAEEEPMSFDDVPLESVLWAGGLVGGPPEGFFDGPVIEAGGGGASGGVIGIAAGIGGALILAVFALAYFSNRKAAEKDNEVKELQMKASKQEKSLLRAASTVRKQGEQLEVALNTVRDTAKKLGDELVQSTFLLDANSLKYAEGNTETHDGTMAKLYVAAAAASVLPRPLPLNPTPLTRRRLGKGAFGNVFLAHYHGTAVAVKEILSDALDLQTIKTKGLGGKAEQLAQSQQNEIKFFQKIRHPNVITGVGFVHEPDYFLVVLEAAEKGSLLSILKKDTDEAVKKMVEQAAMLEQARSQRALLEASERGSPKGGEVGTLTSNISTIGDDEDKLAVSARAATRASCVVASSNPLCAQTVNEAELAKFLTKLEADGYQTIATRRAPGKEEAEKTKAIHQARNYGWPSKLKSLTDIAAAMEFVHGQFIVHRDLKCDNVLVTAR